MTEQEIIEGNKLIAEFMGDYRAKYKVSNDYTLANAMLKTLKYHSSWDWLMPVVEKIKDVMTLGYFNIDSTWHDELRQEWVIQWSNSSPSRSFCIKRSDFKRDIKLIELVWLAVIEFFKWYNISEIRSASGKTMVIVSTKK